MRRLYRQVDGQYYFVGDPSPFDYEGPRYSYYGAHPVADVERSLRRPIYCYLRGPHYHWYTPPPQAQFELKGGAYWYVGTYDPVYYNERPRYVVVNDAYTPIVYTRPVIDVRVAPPAFHGEIVAADRAGAGRRQSGRRSFRRASTWRRRRRPVGAGRRRHRPGWAGRRPR